MDQASARLIPMDADELELYKARTVRILGIAYALAPVIAIAILAVVNCWAALATVLAGGYGIGKYLIQSRLGGASSAP